MHDRVTLSSTELKAIAELERAERVSEAAELAQQRLEHQRKPVRAALCSLATMLAWLAPVGFVLMVLPAPLGWRVVGLVTVAAGLARLLGWAAGRVRSRHRRAHP